jgi:hypothetical protein
LPGCQTSVPSVSESLGAKIENPFGVRASETGHVAARTCSAGLGPAAGRASRDRPMQAILHIAAESGKPRERLCPCKSAPSRSIREPVRLGQYSGLQLAGDPLGGYASFLQARLLPSLARVRLEAGSIDWLVPGDGERGRRAIACCHCDSPDYGTRAMIDVRTRGACLPNAAG